MKKYLAGGKAMAGSSGTSVKEDCSQTGQAFSALLAMRERQMADLWAPTQTQTQTQTKTQNQIVLKPVQQTQNNRVENSIVLLQNNRQADINTILDGDY